MRHTIAEGVASTDVIAPVCVRVRNVKWVNEYANERVLRIRRPFIPTPLPGKNASNLFTWQIGHFECTEFLYSISIKNCCTAKRSGWCIGTIEYEYLALVRCPDVACACVLCVVYMFLTLYSPTGDRFQKREGFTVHIVQVGRRSEQSAKPYAWMQLICLFSIKNNVPARSRGRSLLFSCRVTLAILVHNQWMKLYIVIVFRVVRFPSISQAII